MDLSLLRHLQEIAAIENDPALWFDLEEETARIDASYEHVILVDQSLVDGVDLDQSAGDVCFRYKTVKGICDESGKEGSSVLWETNSLTRAMLIACPTALNWSIVLKPGLFVNPYLFMRPMSSNARPPPPKAPNVEIVGLGDARILFTGAPALKQISVGWGKFTLKRLRIYDLRREVNRRTPLFSVYDGARLELIDVKMTTPKLGVVCVMEGSIATFKKCSFYNCLVTILSNGGSVHLEDCLFSHCGTKQLRTIGAQNGSTLSASRIRFIDCSWIAIWVGSRATFDHCQFEVEERSHFASHDDVRKYANCPCIQSELMVYYHVFFLCAGSTAICKDCDFSGYDGVSTQECSKTNVSLQRCRISTAVGLAELKENASMEVTDCHIDTLYLMKIGYNLKGKITFANNEISGTTRRLFLVDDMSKPLLRDVKLKGIKFKDAYFACTRLSPHDQIKSGYTKKFIAQRLNTPDEKNAPVFDNLKMKQCGYCMKSEGEEAIISHSIGEKVEPVVSFRFCSKCRQVCYCSPECQKKHWRDHKLSCPDRATSKSTFLRLKKMNHRH